MAIVPISKAEFDERNPARSGLVTMLAVEKTWFADTDRNMIGAILFDRSDKDWNYVILALHEDGAYRWIAGDSCIDKQAQAEARLVTSMRKMDETGKAIETLFEADQATVESEECDVLFTDINEELKRYFQKHPERLYDLSPRKFEELIASILKDFGFDVELTPATRDGGRDIIAYIRNAVCQYLTFVECKKYAADNKVGVGVVREVSGVHYLKKAAKSMIVTTSFFSKDAKKEAAAIEHQLELKDYNNIKEWLARYAGQDITNR